MIVTTAAGDRPRDPRNQAGLEAERTMAFYLRRAFADEREIFVYNDLRLVLNGDVAQIDHLVLHRSGMVIVESKSVSGEVAVNKCGEWTRRSGRQVVGMPSPVLQAERQEKLLRLMLRANEERILNRVLFGKLQTRFNKYWPVDIFVAIADRGRIKREIEVPELLKADQVPDAIREIIRRHKQSRRSLNPLNGEGDRKLAEDEFGRLVEFLRLSHTPSKAASAQTNRRNSEAKPLSTIAVEPAHRKVPDATSAAAAHSDDDLTCRKCGSKDVRMAYARTSRPYYLRCQECDGATPVSWTCAVCGKPARIRKRGPDFYRVCEEGCGQMVHVFRNPE
jgi:hypothetical protein